MISVIDVVKQDLANVPNVFLDTSGTVLPAPNVPVITALNVILLVQTIFVPLVYLVTMCPTMTESASGVRKENGHPLGLLLTLNARVTFRNILSQ